MCLAWLASTGTTQIEEPLFSIHQGFMKFRSIQVHRTGWRAEGDVLCSCSPVRPCCYAHLNQAQLNDNIPNRPRLSKTRSQFTKAMRNRGKLALWNLSFLLHRTSICELLPHPILTRERGLTNQNPVGLGLISAMLSSVSYVCFLKCL